jgi:hypothetical protein
MKKVCLFALLMLSTFISCGDDEGSGNFLEAKIDGKNYRAEGLLAYGSKSSGELVFYGVVGEGSTQQSLLVRVPSTAKAGDEFTDINVMRIDYTNNEQIYYTTWASDKATGKVTVTNINETSAAGTFEGVLYDSDTDSKKTTLTSGKFDVDFR